MRTFKVKYTFNNSVIHEILEAEDQSDAFMQILRKTSLDGVRVNKNLTNVLIKPETESA